MFSHSFRLIVISIGLSLVLAVLIWRMLDLMILDRQFLKAQGDARSIRVIDTPAYRGMITDRNGTPLAISTPVESVWMNPKAFQATSEELNALARLLKVKPARLEKIALKYRHREFVYLARQLPPASVEKIKNLKIAGINFQQEYKRYYPQLQSTAHVVGFTNIDDKGLEGMELAYDEWLSGEGGKRKVIKDRMGRVVDEIEVIKKPRSGHDLVLSIDNRIQYLAYHALAKACKQFAAKSGSIVVLDSQTAEVLAMVNYPSFNPNARSRFTSKEYRNRAVVDLFEPGSVIKPLSIASALETKQYTPETIIDTRPGWMSIQGHLIQDVHNYGVLDLTGVLAKSSNVGVSKAVLSSPPQQLINLLRHAGFGQETLSHFPGESDGVLPDIRYINSFVLATISFGYGLSVNALQMAKSALIFANHGKLRPVSMLAGQPAQPSEQVLSPKTADEVLLMMETVVESGTGRSAKVPGYRVAGKTGTARVAGSKGYEKNRHIASFVGIAPVSHPRIVVFVVIHEPTQKGYYASAVAGPLFAEVMGDALRVLNIPPDKVA